MTKRPTPTSTRTSPRRDAKADAPEQHLGTDSTYPEPPIDGTGGITDNPLNPRGIPTSLTDGSPDSQATDAQKAQNPVPKRPPVAATMYPDPIGERVSAAQNRKPPQEIIP